MMAQHINQKPKIASGALVGLGVVFVVQMLSVTTLDLPLKVSVWSFAVSIPLLSAVFVTSMEEKPKGGKNADVFLSIVATIGYLGAIVGICGLFFHFATYAGLIFVVSCVIAFLATSLWIGSPK